ncbi:class II 3-deoxy-7-phosphoheptulonate synthase [Streptomyces sp. NBC_01304]|uniref:class II 3-deoxy-7-phosphoheptulonate synthase n=1 Tax=Streptomyces sp. NBC_01304 TaxID=2903818 RepID=UPI002E124D83|nr:3-deoxy-7-phosphoheptulonate synthase class II [Streptomyces sp. NBC_01304]
MHIEHPPELTWVSRPAQQQPCWPDPVSLQHVRDQLAASPPLVLAQECDLLTQRLAAACRGEAFLLQGGDCAETFAQLDAATIHSKITTLLQMATVLSYGAALPVVKVGRLAGQYAKPRSQPTETRDGITLPAYRGDAVNAREFTRAGRTADPQRLLHTYQASAATLNLARSFLGNGLADLRRVHLRNQDFAACSPSHPRYAALTGQVEQAFRFMDACGATPQRAYAAEFFVSHEGLLLDYEAPLTRAGRTAGPLYNVGSHMLWLGDRTRGLGHAHVAYFASIRNPVAVKLGPTATPDDALALIDKLNPDQQPGRLTFITRFGASHVRDKLPGLVEKVTASGSPVVWVCDPMHGNTQVTADKVKTRDVDDILDEVTGFFEVHRELGTHPGGIHVELTGTDVTECLGGSHPITPADLHSRYESGCDPRLNHRQALDLAFHVADLCLRHRPPQPEQVSRSAQPNRPVPLQRPAKGELR